MVLFIIGMVALLKGSDLFINGGSYLASRYAITPSTVGFIVVAFGTSLPEFVVCLNAAVSGNADIATGNIIGSNIANIALVMAICGVIKPQSINTHNSANLGTSLQIGLMLIATTIFVIFAWSGSLSSPEGALLLLVFLVIIRILWSERRDLPANKQRTKESLNYLVLVGGFIAVVGGAHIAVHSAVTIADILGIPPFIIGLTLVAIGTSLPELAISIIAIAKNESGISVGNLLGSNIFNILFIMGIIALILPVTFDNKGDLLAMALFSATAIPMLFFGEKVTRLFSGIILIGYFAYIGTLMGLI